MPNDVTPFPFATVQDLKDRWPDMPPGSDSYAATLLEDASQFMLDLYPREVAAATENTRKRVVSAVVRRSMDVNPALVGLESYQQGAGQYQATVRPTNPHGDFYLTSAERKALGVGKQRAFEVDLLAGSRRAYEDYYDAGV